MFTLKNLIYVVVLLIVIQFIPYGKDHTNPTPTNIVKWDSQKTKALFTKACADCHSFNTRWPSYSNYAPASWLIMADIQEGREYFNISTGVSRKNLHDAIEAIDENDMPPLQYTLIAHKDAKLTDKEKLDLMNGLKRTLSQ